MVHSDRWGPEFHYWISDTKKTKPGIFRWDFNGCKRRQKFCGQNSCLKLLNFRSFEFWLGVFPVTRGANQKMSQPSLQLHPSSPLQGWRIEDEFASTGPWGGETSTRGGGPLPFKKADVFWMCFKNKKIGGNPICEGRGQPTIYT